MDSQSKTLVLGILAGAALAWAIWMIMKPKKGHGKEGFLVAGQLNNLGSIDGGSPTGMAEPPDVPYAGQPVESSLDQAYGIPSAGERYDALLASNVGVSPMEAAALPQFNVDVTNPSNWTAQVQLRLPIKNPRWLESDPYRGDIVINRTPNACVSDTSIYANRDSLNYQGFFSPFSNLSRFQSPYMKSLNCSVTSQGTVCDN